MRKREIGMRKLKELLRYKGLGISQKKVSRALGVSWKTVKKYWARAEAKGVIYSESLTEEELERGLIVEYGEPIPSHQLDQCEWQRIADEVCRSKVGLNILWEEETAAGRFHLGYSQFCRRFARHHRRCALSFHKEYEPGKIGEVDFCDGVELVDLKTGAVLSTQLFLMILGASRYTYAEFCLSQDLPTWLDLHTHAFEYFGGVPEAIVPDNLKSGVTKACRYEPDLNPTYTELACHYGFIVLPARVGKPKDKPLVERAALDFQKWFYQRWRHRKFYSLAELNQQLWEDLVIYNGEKIHRRFQETRGARFERLEKGVLQSLPSKRFELAVWKKAKAHPDCHIAFERSFYSVPFALRGEYLDVRATSSTVEIYHKGKRVAAHLRSLLKGRYQTNKEHLPPEHKAILEITPQRLLEEAVLIGLSCEAFVTELFAKYGHPTLGLRAAQGIVRLTKNYPPQRVEAACQRALQYKAITFKAVRQILQRGLDQSVGQTLDWNLEQRRLNPNLRGKEYFH